MSLSYDDPRDLRLAPREWLFLGLTIAFWAGFVVYLGKDTSWDFRNYHWYIPYAYLHGRMGIDVVVAHQASYYNPFLDIPFYELATHTPVWFALAMLGAVQGANVVPLYLIARQSLRLDEYRIGAAALALLGQTGGLTLGLLGLHYYDNVMSVFILSGIAILVVNAHTLREGSLTRTALWTALAGLLVGMTPGLKLPEAPFALGFAAGLIALGGSWKHQGVRLIAGGLGGIAGFALFSAWWMLEMRHQTAIRCSPISTSISIRRWRCRAPIATCASCRRISGARCSIPSCSPRIGRSPTTFPIATSASHSPMSR